MRLTMYQSSSGPRLAAFRGDGFVDLNYTEATLPHCSKALLALGPEAVRRAARVLSKGGLLSPDIPLLTPVVAPGKIVCCGANYADHARESGIEPPEEPIIFSKFATTLAKNGDTVRLPTVSDAVDYEAELVVVIGIGGKDIPREKAMDHVGGYCCGNDVSARDWQKDKPGGQWLLGKSFDGFGPIGPLLVTADEIPDPGNLGVRLRLNGETMQESSTSHFIFPIDYLISYVSRVATLFPGDLLFTGTPPGVGMARNPRVFLKRGDVMEVEIDGLGILRNPVG